MPSDTPPRTDTIRIVGAREHNLRNVALELPKNQLICFTGVSGSGKSSLAFDTLFAEGQRRYIESLSAYARQFLGQLPKPDVDQITGLAPSISIQQKSSGWNPRSTVGTITQIHDYARVLFARAGVQHCPRCGRPISAQTRDQMLARILALGDGVRLMLLAPKVRAQKGEYKDLFTDLVHQGFARARVDGQVIELTDPPALDRYRRHDIEVVVDRLVLREGIRPRLADSLETALAAGGGTVIVALPDGPAAAAGGRAPGLSEEAAPAEPAAGAAAADASADGVADRRPAESFRAARRRAPRGDRVARAGRPAAGNTDIILSAGFACTECELSFEPPSPQMFSFNSPQGMCSHCDGLGTRFDFDPALLIPDPALPFLAPAVAALRHPPGRWRAHLYRGVARHFGADLDQPWRDLPKPLRHALLYGTGDTHIMFEWKGRQGRMMHGGVFEGVIAELMSAYRRSESPLVRGFYEQFMRESPCPICRGSRLNPQALAVRIESRGFGALNLPEVGQLSIRRALDFFQSLELEGVRRIIAEEPLKEITARLQFLVDVGLDYLALDRAAPTLSGGESQRIRLASQIGCGLVGVLYVLDEPSIGLHPRDNLRLLHSLQRLRDMGNTVIVVEHDRDTMEAADWIVDFGPGPGVRGGRVVAAGAVADLAQAPDSLTGAYLSNRRRIETPPQRRPILAPAESGAPAARRAPGRSSGRARRNAPAQRSRSAPSRS